MLQQSGGLNLDRRALCVEPAAQPRPIEPIEIILCVLCMHGRWRGEQEVSIRSTNPARHASARQDYWAWPPAWPKGRRSHRWKQTRLARRTPAASIFTSPIDACPPTPCLGTLIRIPQPRPAGPSRDLERRKGGGGRRDARPARSVERASNGSLAGGRNDGGRHCLLCCPHVPTNGRDAADCWPSWSRPAPAHSSRAGGAVRPQVSGLLGLNRVWVMAAVCCAAQRMMR